MALTFVVLSTDNEASRLIKAALSAGSNTRLVAEAQTPERLLSDVQLLRPSGVILVVSQAPTDAECGMVKKIGSTYPGTAVITASTNSSSSVILRSIRSGAHEFLPLPINAEEFRTVMERVQEFQTVSEESMKKLGRLVAIFSGKGGAGPSFLAPNRQPQRAAPIPRV